MVPYSSKMKAAASTTDFMQSILAKLRRPGGRCQLGTMDDIGGCRLILRDIDQASQAASILRERLELKQGNNVKNYIEEPRASGTARAISSLLTRKAVPDIALRCRFVRSCSTFGRPRWRRLGLFSTRALKSRMVSATPGLTYGPPTSPEGGPRALAKRPSGIAPAGR